MSITSCFLILLLCLSIHACTARRLGAVYTCNKHANKALHFSTKNDDTKELEDADVVKFKGTVEKEKTISTSGAIQTNKHVVSVSWKVPHRKRGDKLPGFNHLDYAPPKTHPPSHN